jgi:hypothetical protein
LQAIEEHVSDTNAGKKLSTAATDVLLTLVLKNLMMRTLTTKCLSVKGNVPFATIDYIFKVF